MPPAPRRLHELGLALLSILSVIVVIEGAFRLGAWRENRRGFERAMALARPPEPGATVTLGGLIRPSINPRIVYDLWPGMDVFFDNGRGRRSRVVTGRTGFRDRDHAADNGRGVRRVVGIGDSLMFGWGVEQEQDYLSQVEERLNDDGGEGGAWEVVNTAVPGYNTAMEVETLEVRGLAYRPDLVVLGFCPNDAGLPSFILAQRDVLSMHEWFVVGFVRGRFEPLPGGDALAPAPRRGDGRALEDDPARVPSAYRSIVGWVAFERALRRLRSLAQVHGFRILVVAFSEEAGRGAPRRWLHTRDDRKDRGLHVARELGLPILDVGKAEAAYMRAHGIDAYVGSVMTVSAQDPHPSALSHGIAAAELLAWMAREGLVSPRAGPRLP